MFNILSLLNKNTAASKACVLDTKRWITELPQNNEFEAQRLLTQTLHAFLKSEAPLTRERLKILLQLDQSSHALQRELCQQYHNLPDHLKQGEQAFWKSIYSMYWLLAHAYQAFIKDHVQNNGKSDTASYQSLITARTLRYFRMEIKWRYFRQEPIEPAMWQRLHKLYQLSELGNFTEKPVKLVDDSDDTTTCKAEYAKILLMDLLKPVTLKPAHIETIEGLIKHWAKLIEFQPAAATHTHCIELSQGAGVTRMTNCTTGENYRCWNMAELMTEVFRFKSNLVYMLDNKKITIDMPADELLGLLDLAVKLWMRSAPKRQAETSLNAKTHAMPVEA